MKLLLVSHQFSDPPRTGGDVILHNHIKQLATKHTIDLIALGVGKVNKQTEIATYCNSVALFSMRSPGGITSLLESPRTWFTSPGHVFFLILFAIKWLCRIPLAISPYADGRVFKYIQGHTVKNKFEAVLFYGVSSAQYLGALRGSRGTVKILNLENPLGFYLGKVNYLHKSFFVRAVMARERRLISRYEGSLRQAFDCVTLLNSADLAEYRRYAPEGGELHCVPYGVDTNYFKPDTSVQRVPGRIIITGNLYHPPNVEGVHYFCREIYPLIQKKIPNVSLFLVGGRPVQQIFDLASENIGITVIGSVPDIRPYLRAAMVSVCPVQLAVGTQTKILEAMASGTPVVSTPEGNHGVCGTAGEHLHIADNPRGFAEKMIALMNGANWKLLSETGRRFAVDHFDWSVATRKLERIVAAQIAETKS